MSEKIELLKRYLPKAILEPMTEEAREAVPVQLLKDGRIVIDKFPFRVGRESRVQRIDGRWQRIERPKMDNSDPNNDLYLVDKGRLLNVSREHFQIEEHTEGFLLVDRGSACGTRIGELAVGGSDCRGDHPLNDGDLIAVGAKGTPYIYRFVELRGFAVVELGNGVRDAG